MGKYDWLLLLAGAGVAAAVIWHFSRAPTGSIDLIDSAKAAMPPGSECGCSIENTPTCDSLGAPPGTTLAFLVDGLPYCLGAPVSVGQHAFVITGYSSGVLQTLTITVTVNEGLTTIVDPSEMTPTSEITLAWLSGR